MNVYGDIVHIFTNITKGEPIATLDRPYMYYYADTKKQDIIIKNIISIDIKSAFPTICKILFGLESQFVKNIFEKTDKKERNIYIATSLKQYNDTTNINYLSELNRMSKLLIFNYAFSHFSNIQILEYVKDGMYIHGIENIDYDNELVVKFLNIMKEYEIVFHHDIIDTYLRFNKTSIYKIKDNLIIKGKYKDLPSCILDIFNNLFKGIIYNLDFTNLIKKYYSDLYFNILLKSGIKEQLNYIYKCSNDKYLDSSGNYTENLSEICPKSYLFNIIYPVLNLIRLQESNTY